MGWDLRRRPQEGAGAGGFVMEMEDMSSRQRTPSQHRQMSGNVSTYACTTYIMLFISTHYFSIPTISPVLTFDLICHYSGARL